MYINLSEGQSTRHHSLHSTITRRTCGPACCMCTWIVSLSTVWCLVWQWRLVWGWWLYQDMHQDQGDASQVNGAYAYAYGRTASDNHTQRLVLPSFPLFGGERGCTLASLHTFCLSPLAFASVSRCVKALFATQHRHRPVVYPATRHSTFHASYRSLQHSGGYTSTWGPEGSKPWPISAVSVKFGQAAA